MGAQISVALHIEAAGLGDGIAAIFLIGEQ
jgi:hypothetical protein